jgi:pimeloyl-ACP methyl ester carboxylesterase
MHRGYRIIARECADALAPLMTPGYSVQLTGHSLGGAVAVATALLFRSRGASVEKVVTFGAPKLGPRETRDAAEPLDVLRVVQKDDLIPLLPMSRPFVRKPYVHLGEGVVLDNDAPGRYARLTKEWGTAGILWKHKRHTGYARGESLRSSTSSDDLETESEKKFSDSAFVSADEPDDGTPFRASDSAVSRRGRFSAARERLRRLRAALGEGIARRRAAFAAETAASADAVGVGTEKDQGKSEALATRWLSERDRDPDPAPFDDVEGELFVRVAETTPDSFGASDVAYEQLVAAAAADEWERATAATDRESLSRSTPFLTPARNARVGTSSSDALGPKVEPPAAKSWLARTSARDADHRAGPTIFEELWKLRGMDAETRGSKLESHRMRRYVEEIQRAIDAGPVQTSLAGVYAGKEGDEVGLDFSGDDSDGSDDATVEGGVASWMTWTR